MGDGARGCLGVLFLFAAVVLAIAAFAGGWLGWEFKVGVILGVVTFSVFFALAGLMFISMKDYSWLTTTIPAILGGAYTVLPDVLPGAQDDILVLLLGATISGLITWRKSRWLAKQNEKIENPGA
jgi:hypothetical protein